MNKGRVVIFLKWQELKLFQNPLRIYCISGAAVLAAAVNVLTDFRRIKKK